MLVHSLDFQAGFSGRWLGSLSLAKVAAGAGPGAFSCRVACAIGRRAAARRIRRPRSPRVKDHVLASLKFREREREREREGTPQSAALSAAAQAVEHYETTRSSRSSRGGNSSAN